MSNIIEFFAALGAFYVLICAGGAIAIYIYGSYVLNCIGKKTGLTNDWLAYVPIAKTIYCLSILQHPWWHLFFFGSAGLFCAGVISMLLIALLGDWVGFACVVGLCYAGFTLFYTIRFYMRLYEGFGFNRMIVFCSFLGIFKTMIAFYHQIQWKGGPASLPSPSAPAPVSPVAPLSPAAAVHTPPAAPPPVAKGTIVGESGSYAGMSFPIEDGETVAVGRDAKICSIVFAEGHPKVSRKHCEIRYAAKSGTYFVTDFSKNGTFLANGTRLIPQSATPLKAGSTIALGGQDEVFRLK